MIAGLVIGVAVVPSWGGMMGPRSAMMGNTMPGIDSHFIEQMIPHHEDAILMADLALEKSKRSEIKKLADDIQRSQSAEIEQMKTWHKNWFGKEVSDVFSGMGHGGNSGMIHMGMMGNTSDLESLKSATDFDKAFIEEMIPHHQMAVMMAQMLENSTGRPEMKELARNIIEAQTREINEMRGWYRAWYENK